MSNSENTKGKDAVASGVDAIVVCPCPDCGEEMGDPVDTTFSNIHTDRAKPGQHTGDIYECEKCEQRWIDDFLNDVFRQW